MMPRFLPWGPEGWEAREWGRKEAGKMGGRQGEDVDFNLG